MTSYHIPRFQCLSLLANQKLRLRTQGFALLSVSLKENMTLKNHKTYQALLARGNGEGKMPSVKAIHELLEELGVPHRYDGETVNTVERRITGKTYVYDRHEGKSGKSIEFYAKVKDGEKSPFTNFSGESTSLYFGIDSSSSYYSWNTGGYARDLVNVLDNLSKLIITRN